MKIGIFDPYLDTLGGGERFILTLASFLSKENDVSLFWDNPHDLERAPQILNIDTSRLNIVSNLFKNKNFIERLLLTRKFDAIFFMSDGSVPFLFSKRNYIIFQFPVNWINENSPLLRIKLLFLKRILCYSRFVKDRIDKHLKIDSLVVYPPVRLDFKNMPKEKIILTVGRFTKGINTKNQEFLIDVFAKHKNEFSGWKLIVAGTRLEKDKDYVDDLRNKVKDANIEILDNLTYEKVRELFSKSKIYWHAAGYGQDLNSHPEKAEHFGISTVEAMAAGSVPIVFNGGGLREIVDDEKQLLWNNEEELLNATMKLIESEKKWTETSKRIREKSKKFSEESFYRTISSLLN